MKCRFLKCILFWGMVSFVVLFVLVMDWGLLSVVRLFCMVLMCLNSEVIFYII